MQGSGTASVESTIGSVIPPEGKLLVINNGAYGNRIDIIAKYLKIETLVLNCGEVAPPKVEDVIAMLDSDPGISHVALVHCETTTGMLNPIKEIAEITKSRGKTMILDAMSSFGGIPMDIATL